LRLALARGISHSQLLHTTSAKELSEYRALNLINPLFDGDRIDQGNAMVANIIFNMLRDPSVKPTSIVEWMPDYEARFKPQEETQDDIALAFDAWAVQINTQNHR
jgi:hypothetical protein